MDRENAIELLRGGREGVAEWNRRRQAGEVVPDLGGVDLGAVNLAGAMLGGAQLASANLKGADLSGADLTSAVLLFAHLADADLVDTRARQANLIGADLRGADLMGADLRSAQLIRAHLNDANCTRAAFHGADLSNADLAGADLTSADFSGATLVDADLTCAVLRSANIEQAVVMGVKYDRRRMSCRGIRADSCYGNAIFKRDLQDQDWIETYQAQSRWHYFVYVLWAALTDCGRSLWRVIGIAALLDIVFGVVYTSFPWLLDMSRSAKTAWTPFYYSTVTLTTLGFGDVTPACLAGEILVTVEVILGYLTLGVLVSILASVVARRS